MTEKMKRATVISDVIRAVKHVSSASLTGRKEMKDRKVSGEITAENTKFG